MSWVVRLIVVLPALAALAGLLTRRSVTSARVLAVGTAAVVTGLAVAQWLAPVGRADIGTLGPLPLRDLGVTLHLLSDDLSGLVTLAVGLVVLAIQVFTVWYQREDPRYTRFAASISLFASGMLLVAQSADLVLTLVGWEIMGWCSWLLIGHESERAAARRAAYKAYLVTCTADIAMFVGLIALSARAGTTDLVPVLSQPAAAPLLTFGLVCVVVGVAGKSGLVPFQDWLPDAMEGPTPASALIHAATMVAAGSYVIARLLPLYAADDVARTLLGILSALTMVYAAGLAFAQTDLKRLLAYSTLSQVAIMLGALAAAPAAIGVGPGMGQLVSHAFFKALLFLGTGWLIALVGATTLVAMTGRLGRLGSPRALRWAMGIGLAALAGVPPLMGFVTKDTVVDAAVEGLTEAGGGFRAGVVLFALLLTVVLTAAYCTRAWLILAPTSRVAPSSTGSRAPTGRVAPSSTGPHHAPISLAAALSVAGLAVATVLGTLLLFSLPDAVHLGLVSAIVSVVLIGVAAAVVFAMSNRGRNDAADRLPTRVREDAARGFGADTAYVGIATAVTALARLVVTLDRDVVDAYPRAAAAGARTLGRVGQRVHRAVPSLALLGLVIGVVLIAASASWWR